MEISDRVEVANTMIEIVPGTEENLSKLINRFGYFSRFYAVNSIVYAIETTNDSIVKAIESSRYERFKRLIDAAISDLSERENGCYLSYSRLGWVYVPISVTEAIASGNSDFYDLLIPQSPFYPLVII